MMNGKTVVIAMSGGVDSSVAALLLKKADYNVIGITLKTFGFDDVPVNDSGCCSLEAIYNAKNVADNLKIPHYTFDFTEIFDRTVIDNFINEYMNGFTPNPCVLCNKKIKWGVLLDKAIELGADYIATGHYANLNYNKELSRYYISCGLDKEKDQSYALWKLSQDALSKSIFPLGKYTKMEIREIAFHSGLKSASTPDSQEICFVPNNNYRELLQLRVKDINEKAGKGDIFFNGKKVGEHEGFPYYTIGQRKGLKLSLGYPVYVSKIDPKKNRIYVDKVDGLFNDGFIADDINFMKYDNLTSITSAKVKVRYKDEGSDAIIEQLDNNRIKVVFKSPKKSITPGQSAVFYDNNDIIGGGIIREIIKSNLPN